MSPDVASTAVAGEGLLIMGVVHDRCRCKCSVAVIAIGLLVAGGCDGGPSSEFRKIDQTSSNSTHRGETDRDNIVANAVADGPTETIDVPMMMMSVPAEMSQLTLDPISALDFANKRRIELLVPTKDFSTDRKTGALQLSFDDINLLKILNMETVTDDAVTFMPQWLTSLNGKKVRTRGFMLPTYEAEGLELFVLLRDNQECCYGPKAKIYDHILVKMKPGTTTNYVPIQRSLDVVGTFQIDLQSAGGKLLGLYVIEDASVIVR